MRLNDKINPIMITGGLGFVGSTLIKHLSNLNPALEIINVDCNTYAANPSNLDSLGSKPKYRYEEVNIADYQAMETLFKKYAPSAVINCAAESHVDRSIFDSINFARTNVLGIQVILELSRKYNARLLQVSTDEVYGSLENKFEHSSENMRLSPTSPYAASKASADLMVLAAFKSHNQDVVITRSSNNYGPFQHPEKLIPLVITNALQYRELPIYGTGINIRDWIHVDDHCNGILSALEKGTRGNVYNLGGNNELTNITIVKMILSILNRPISLIQYVKDRPGHDLRYSINSSKAQLQLQWNPQKSFTSGLEETVGWYKKNRKWWENIKDKEFENYYKNQYESKLR
tara:strand:- start:2042 stop:3079 length:1038 start_codon:yes stop_codon:yes gene_type:complete